MIAHIVVRGVDNKKFIVHVNPYHISITDKNGTETLFSREGHPLNWMDYKHFPITKALVYLENAIIEAVQGDCID